jgi:hypothetical protein
MLLAEQCVANLRRILLEARKVHSQQDYVRVAEPILLEVQQRQQEIIEYLSRDVEQQSRVKATRQSVTTTNFPTTVGNT